MLFKWTSVVTIQPSIAVVFTGQTRRVGDIFCITCCNLWCGLPLGLNATYRWIITFTKTGSSIRLTLKNIPTWSPLVRHGHWFILGLNRPSCHMFSYKCYIYYYRSSFVVKMWPDYYPWASLKDYLVYSKVLSIAIVFIRLWLAISMDGCILPRAHERSLCNRPGGPW